MTTLLICIGLTITGECAGRAQLDFQTRAMCEQVREAMVQHWHATKRPGNHAACAAKEKA
jgi:hypothetical protein